VAAIGWGGPVEASARVAPGASTRQTATLLGERAAATKGALVVVGHEPSISALAELLGGGERVSAFHKAEAALVEDGVVRWRLAAP
jgi:phosphohistidine phosphatase SixA